ncbi:ABC transporter ATP-binding protein [Ramlibacter albus]|uniref:ABC transporter ATP-binding protein n=1 Tax=Ramlibacter albus TaxID=2079448 RepID=A0A923S1Q3_9BURK|nr:ABC transporter ATP-binding protein [Ramlibacter albus]MBC5764540.1 ABC transporter ATP-binding protein [Ramlibacter albus]
MSDTPVLSIEDVSVGLPAGADRATAVRNVSFTVGRGEIVCLVGESGSGKSVLAQAVMGLLPRGLPVQSGRIRLEGEDITHVPASRLRELRATRMGMIFQEPMTALNPVMTCGDQVDEVLREHTSLSPEQRRAKVLDIIREVMLPEPERIIASYPHQLSGGQRQRIMIAMALVLDPVLLIADEPTTALDVTTQAQILKLVLDLQARRGTGVLFITHDFGVVAEVAHRVAVLRLGELVEIGDKQRVLQHPVHSYTQMLVAAVPTLNLQQRDLDGDAPIVLSVKGLAKTYDSRNWFGRRRRVDAAQDVSFEIRRGQTLGIVGESGSGKSTVARCIVRLIDPSGGQVLLGRPGEGAAHDDIAMLPPRALQPLRKRVQIVFQDPYRSLNPRRTVAQAMVEGPMNYGLSREAALARARELLGLVRMDPSAMDRYPHQFSGGQRQRICIARALMMDPELLVADEAVSALDVSVQAQVLQLLAEIRGRLNLAMLFITHDLRVASQVCDQLVVMSNGRIVESGPAHRVFARPEHEYTQALFAAAPGRGFAFGRS